MDALLSFLLQNGDEIDLDEQPVTPSSANTENINAFDFQISNITGNLTINVSIGKDSIQVLRRQQFIYNRSFQRLKNLIRNNLKNFKTKPNYN